MKLFDQHIHSIYSEDSDEPLESYYKKAIENNIEYVVTCEHYDPHTIISHKTWLADYDKLIAEQKSLKEKYPTITPLLGIEMGYRKDCLEETIAYVNKQKFDIIQFSLHDDGIVDFYMDNAFEENPYERVKYYFNLLYQGICDYKNYDVLSHIDYGFKVALRLDKSLKINMFEDILQKIFKVIINEGKALEINTKVQESINDDEHIKNLLNIYKKIGGTKLTLSSDAHDSKRYMSSFPKYLKIIKECGFENLSVYIKRGELKIKI